MLHLREIEQAILAQGRIDAEEAAWLRWMLFADGKIKAEGRSRGNTRIPVLSFPGEAR
jgi:hypothetical protein